MTTPPDRIARLLRDGQVVCERLAIADRPWRRMRGLLGKKRLDPDEGLWITPCNSIHMLFMRFAIDVVFVDRDLRVVRIHESVAPWRFARGGRAAHSVFELAAGSVAAHGITIGDTLIVDGR